MWIYFRYYIYFCIYAHHCTLLHVRAYHTRVNTHTTAAKSICKYLQAFFVSDCTFHFPRHSFETIRNLIYLDLINETCIVTAIITMVTLLTVRLSNFNTYRIPSRYIYQDAKTLDIPKPTNR